MTIENDVMMVAIQSPKAVVIVRGRGTFKAAPALKKFGLAAMEAKCTLLLLDMRECVGMDSTFMGVVGGLATRLRKDNGGEVAMVNLSVKNKALLSTLGLDRCVKTEGAEDELAAFMDIKAMAKLDSAAASRNVTTQTMLDAHHDLISISPDNMAKFKDVIAYLQDEMQRDREKDEKGG